MNPKKETSIEIMCMNCNCMSSTIKSPISKCVEDIICQKQPDIVILTEIVIDDENTDDDENTELKLPGYKVCLGPRNYYQDNSGNFANQVVIAVKKGIKVTNDKVIDPYESSDHFPDCHWIKIEVGEKCCNVIGFRMPSMGYNEEKRLFDKFVEYIKPRIRPGEITILAGDFNNGRYYGSLSESFEGVESYYRGKDHYPYNLHCIKDSLDKEMGLKLRSKGCWSYVHVVDKPDKFATIADDHLFASKAVSINRITFYPTVPASVHWQPKDYPFDHRYFIAEASF